MGGEGDDRGRDGWVLSFQGMSSEAAGPTLLSSGEDRRLVGTVNPGCRLSRLQSWRVGVGPGSLRPSRLGEDVEKLRR